MSSSRDHGTPHTCGYSRSIAQRLASLLRTAPIGTPAAKPSSRNPMTGEGTDLPTPFYMSATSILATSTGGSSTSQRDGLQSSAPTTRNCPSLRPRGRPLPLRKHYSEIDMCNMSNPLSWTFVLGLLSQAASRGFLAQGSPGAFFAGGTRGDREAIRLRVRECAPRSPTGPAYRPATPSARR